MLPNRLTIEQQCRGVRIISGWEAKARRVYLNEIIGLATIGGFDEIILPTIEPAGVYEDKAGSEILGQMYTFNDKKDRLLCLRPEGTATVQLIADEHLNGRGKDVKLWYFERCYRYERPQAGRYREFYQFGLEWINPSNREAAMSELLDIAKKAVSLKTDEFTVNTNVKRGLSYYTGLGFEIEVPSLGTQKQVCGGGEYKQGIGLGLGFDRLMEIV